MRYFKSNEGSEHDIPLYGHDSDDIDINSTESQTDITASPSRKVDDVVAKLIGDFGKWQLRLSIMMALLKFPIAWYQLNIIFLAPPTEFWCKKPESFSGVSDEEWRQMSTPLIEEHPCLIFDPEILHIDPTLNKELIPLVKCESFEYNLSVFTRTIISEWDLVCEKQWMVSFTQVVIMCGVLLGGIIFGVIGDKCGRKSPLMISIVMQSLFSYVSCFMSTYWTFLVSTFLLSLASGGVGILSFVTIIEVVSGKWRTIIPVLYQLPFGLGNPAMTGLAYWLRDWRKLQFALSTLSALFVTFWFCLSESPRWLLATGDTAKAYEVLKKAADINKRPFKVEEVKEILEKAKGRQEGVPDLMAFVRSKKMRIITILLSLNWFVTGLGFYVLAQYLGWIGENIFLTVMLSGLISSIGPIICVFVIMNTGRKITLAIFEVSTALCFLVILLIPRGKFTNDWPRLLFAGIGFGGLAGSVPVLYLFSGELYPTLGRNVGVSGVSTFARIGSMLAPMVAGLNDLQPDLPLFIIAAMSFAQVLLLLLLPETMNRPLPDTIKQAEELYQSRLGEKYEEEID